MTGVRFELSGADAAIAAIAAAAGRLDHPRPMYDDMGRALVVSTQMRFEREEGPDGNPWPPSLRKLVEGGLTLTDTARMKNSITHEASDARLAVGTNVIQAAIHQFGGVIKAKTSRGLRFRRAGDGGWVNKQSVTIPARPFLGLDADDEKELIAIAGDYVTAPLGGRE